MKELLVGYDTVIGTPAYQEAEGYDVMNAYTSVAGGGVAKEFRVFARTSYAGNAKIYANKADLSLAASVTAAMYQAGWNTFAISDAAIAGSAQFYLGAVCSPQVLLGYDGGTALEYYRTMAYGDFTPGTINLSNYDTYSPYHYGVAVWGYKPPTITNAEDEALNYDETDFHITVTNGEATQGTGKIWASNSATWGAGTRVEQDVDTWADDGDIIINCVPGTLASGTIYLWIETASGQHNVTGYAVTFTAQESPGVTCTVDIDLPVSVTVSSLVGIKHSAIEIQVPLSVDVSASVFGPPLVEYIANEATSGAGDGTVVDHAANPEDLTIVYGGAYPAYVNDANGTGLNFGTARTYGMGAFNGPLDIGHKVFDALNHSKAVTFETVVKLPSAALGGYDIGNHFVAMQSNGYGCECGLWFWEESGSQNFEISFIDQDTTAANFWSHYYIRHASMASYWGQRVVLHAIIDTANATEENRIRFYINGTRVTLSRTGGHTGITVPQNVEIKITRPTEAPGLDGSTTNSPVYICAGGTPEYHAGSGTMRGEFRQGAIYPRIVSDSEIATRAAILSANDDLAWGTAIFTTAQSGYADVDSTWVGGIAPIAGDRIFRAANHTLTFRVSASFGDDPAADTMVVYGPSSGTDTGGFVVDGCTLSLYGSMLSGPGGFVRLANSGKIHNESTNHQCLYVSSATFADSYLESTATSWATATEISDESGNGFSVREVPDSYYSGKLIGAYCRFKKIDLIQFQKGFDIHHFIFDANCGNVTPLIAVNNAWDYSVVNCTHLSTTAGFIYSVNNSAGTGKRVFHHNICVSEFAAYCADNAPLDVYYSFYPGVNSASDTAISEQRRCIIWGASDPTIVSYGGPVKDSLIVNSSSSNPHFIGFAARGIDVDIDGCIFQYINTYALDLGDLLLMPSPSSVQSMVITMKNCIELAAKDGILSGVITHFGNDYVKSIIHNNTLLGCSSYGETSGPAVDMTPLFANNICYTTPEMVSTPLASNSFTRFLAGCEGFEGIVTVADYNNGVGSDYKYGLPVTADYFGSAPGVHDIDTDPEFVDSTRSIASWAVTWGCASGETFDNKVAYAKTLILAANDEADPSYQADIETLTDDFIGYIREGFTPTVAQPGAGTNISGYTLPTYIGAVEPVLPTPTITSVGDGNIYSTDTGIHILGTGFNA